MTELEGRSLTYSYNGTELVGYFAAEPGTSHPGVLLVHDAFGVSEPMKGTARRIAALGYSVLLVDLWGGGRTPQEDAEIGRLIGGLAQNREEWIGRLRAGHEQLRERDEVADAPVTAVGYCFGGASVLEYVRAGGAIAGAVSLHGGLDLVDTDWSGANRDAAVLILTGADDPMAAPAVVSALQESLSQAGVDWEVASYGNTKHAFTNPHADKAGKPDVIAYNARADRRSWNAFTQFLKEVNEGVPVA